MKSITESLNEHFLTVSDLNKIEIPHKYSFKLLKVLRRREDISHDEQVELTNMLLSGDAKQAMSAVDRINAFCDK